MDEDGDPYRGNSGNPPEDHAGPSIKNTKPPLKDHPDLDAESNVGEPFVWQQRKYPKDDIEDQDRKASHANSIIDLREQRRQCNTGKTDSPGYSSVKYEQIIQTYPDQFAASWRHGQS